MILCENLSKDKINEIGIDVAKAFLAENGAFYKLNMKDAINLFTIIIELCYKTHHLYTTSENMEGFIVYWNKKDKPGIGHKLKLLIKLSVKLSINGAKTILSSQNNWSSSEKRYKKEKEYIEIFLLCVKNEYQGQGYFRAMLEEVFKIAKSENKFVVLETDSEIKAKKYNHVGMKIVDEKTQKSGVRMFALEYR